MPKPTTCLVNDKLELARERLAMGNAKYSFNFAPSWYMLDIPSDCWNKCSTVGPAVLLSPCVCAGTLFHDPQGSKK